MSRAEVDGWKYYVGLALFVYSMTTFPLAALAPLVFSPAAAVTAATAIVLSGEVGFWVSAALLGKPFLDAMKAKLRGWFARNAEHRPHQPISRRRHGVGLVLFSLSLVSYYVAMAIPFFDFTKETELKAIIAVALSGELLFVCSLFVLGSDFWERIKALYCWPGDAPTGSAESPVVSVATEREAETAEAETA